MGAFIIFDISFEGKKDRLKFEKKYKIEKKDILVDENQNCCGFTAWTSMRDPYIEVVYYMGFMGYAEPTDMLNECLKEKIRIKFLAMIPINERNAEWEKIRGKW